MNKISDFYAKVIADANLRAKANEILGGKNIADLSEADLQKLANFAKDEGCDITVAEVKEYINSDAQELTDDALDAVAGGESKQIGKHTCDTEAGGGVKNVTKIKIEWK